MIWWERRKYGKRVLALYEGIVYPLGRSALPALWRVYHDRSCIYAGFGEKDGAETTAAVLAANVIGRMVDQLHQDERKLALFALREENRADRLANNLRLMIEAALHTIPEVQAKSFGYEVIGALEGYTPDQRERYRFQRHLDDLFPGSTGDYESPENL